MVAWLRFACDSALFIMAQENDRHGSPYRLAAKSPDFAWFTMAAAVILRFGDYLKLPARSLGQSRHDAWPFSLP